MAIEYLARTGNLVLAKDEARRYPGLLIQGDTLRVLLDELEEEASASVAAETLRSWVGAYEDMMGGQGFELPYRR